jgi:hypothetical protein
VSDSEISIRSGGMRKAGAEATPMAAEQSKMLSL